jgi:hypothetical protein
MGQSNALVPQSQFRAVKPYFTGSAYIVRTLLGPLQLAGPARPRLVRPLLQLARVNVPS